MLQEIAIHNFAIIEQLHVAFRNGMTVLTGETGAGKSIIIDAVGLLVGGRGSSEFIREGAPKCSLEGVFQIQESDPLLARLNELGLEAEEDQLVIQREIYRNGKNSCRVNGHLVNLTTLRQVGHYLVDIHGQNEHQLLMNPEHHEQLLDEYGGEQLAHLKTTYQTSYRTWQQLAKRLSQQQHHQKEFVQRLDMLRFQSEEIAAAELVMGEEEELLEERRRFTNYQKLSETLEETVAGLQGGAQPVLDLISSLMTNLSSIEEVGTEYKALSETMQAGYYALEEVASDARRQADLLEYDEERAQFVEDRLDVFRQLKRKYGDSLAAIIQYEEEIRQELHEMEASDAESDQLENRVKEAEKTVLETAKALSHARQKVAKTLEPAIIRELKELYLEKARVEIRLTQVDTLAKFTLQGQDQVEFFLSTNVGEPLKPLAKVASGGELSRIMLALKTIFSKSQGITSIIFDEVDTGVSGRVAQAIATKIYEVGKTSQVLCITHLPQVAAQADHQVFIEKKTQAGRTTTHLQLLSEEERVQEIARMLAGDEITPLSVEHARELRAFARKKEKTPKKTT